MLDLIETLLPYAIYFAEGTSTGAAIIGGYYIYKKIKNKNNDKK